MIEYKANSTSRKQIEDNVLKLKQVFGLEEHLCFPIVKFIEWILPKLDENFQLEIVDVHELKGKYAEAIPSKHKIRIREDVYNDACDNKARARFTLCHEVGHYFMHDENTVSLYRIDGNSRIPSYQDPEWQANTFASYLLMTPKHIKNLSIDEICEKCKVSKKAAEIQLSYINNEL